MCFKSIYTFFITVLIIFPSEIKAQNLSDEEVNLSKIPSRIIRPCCAFGYDLKLWAIPFVSIDQVISTEDLANHYYMGHKSEGNGTIYTKKGGFIDIGHLRDQLDWTRYLYKMISNYKGKGEVIVSLRNEGGSKNLTLNIPKGFADTDCIQLAGKITYDLSLWHEISTWFGASAVPLMPEKFSSFSVEDVYSNLLGIHIGMKTLATKASFNEEATKRILSTLDSLDVVKTAQDTYDAYDAVYDKWYTNKKRLPKTGVVLQRDTDILTYSKPWLVPNPENKNTEAVVLDVPLLDVSGQLLTTYYQVSIDLNRKFPVEELFPNRENRIINQDDYSVLLDRINNEIEMSSIDK